MFQTIANYLISDEIHHPVITRLYRVMLVGGVMYNILYVMLETTAKEIEGVFEYPFVAFASLLVFDFLLRIVGAAYGLNQKNTQLDAARYDTVFHYLLSPYGIIDFVGSLQLFVYFFSTNFDLLLVVVLLGALKIARYSPALVILKDVIAMERKTLFAAMYVMLLLTLSSSTIIYFAERSENDGFSSLPDALWWAIITFSTVGYGDVIPHTQVGKILGGLAAISGFGMFALPAGILANAFAQELKRLKEVASWEMVSKVPLFSHLEEGAIFEIASLLRLRYFKKNEIIIKEGTVGESIFFIVEGRVKVIKEDGVLMLGEGEYFGEIALVKKVPRTATVVAAKRCKLLELNWYDFYNLMQKRPDIYKEIEAVAKKRYDETKNGSHNGL